MTEAFLKNPLSLFDIKGKTAIVTGASGAFGALAAQVLAGAGANLVIAAGKADELKKVAAECEALGAKVESVAIRPNSEANCEKIFFPSVLSIGFLIPKTLESTRKTFPSTTAYGRSYAKEAIADAV